MSAPTLIAVLLLLRAPAAPPSSPPTPPPPPAAATADASFAAGLKLIESNCARCKGRSQAALEQGLALVQSALDHGFPQRARAYAALGEGYDALAESVGPVKQGEYTELQIAAAHKALGLEPKNPAALAGLVAAGERLIELNCKTCYPESREALVRGVELVQQALAAGCEPKGRAYRALAKGYNDLAPPKPGPDQDRYLALQRETYRKWVDLEPDNTEALEGLAASVSPEEARRIDERILKLDPGNADIRFVLGIYLFEEGKKKEGLAMMREAWKSPRVDWERGYALVNFLRQAGFDAEAAAVEKETLRRGRHGN